MPDLRVSHRRGEIALVLPYLNATLSGASFLPEPKALTWKDDGHTIAFHRREIAVSDVDDLDDAAQLIDDQILNAVSGANATMDGSSAEAGRPLAADCISGLQFCERAGIG